jgi:hypothetical protein
VYAFPVEAGTLSGQIAQKIRAAAVPVLREGRIVGAPLANGRVNVTVLAGTGPTQVLGPCPGAHPYPALDDDDNVILIVPARGDRCWLAISDQGEAIVTSWEKTT